jgi:hypothetical protein
MANDANTQQALAADPHFRARVGGALAKTAFVVIAQGRDNANEIKRYDYATNVVLLNVGAVAAQIAPWLVERTNLFAFDTSYDFASLSVVTAAGDADIEAQLLADWDVLAGVTP